MTGDEQAFLNAICTHPADDTVRLVYADWLEEHGDPDRGEFIRTEIELARTPPGTDGDERRRRVLFERRAALLKSHQTAWLATFAPFAKESSFVRGFVQALEVPAHSFLQSAERWFALTPLTRLKITTWRMWDNLTQTFQWWADALFASPYLARLEVLDLENTELAAADLAALGRQPTLPNLRELVLAFNDVRSEGAAVLANMPQLGNLESLDLRGNGITDTGARAVAQSAHLGALKELRISRNSIRDRAWAALEQRFGDALVG